VLLSAPADKRYRVLLSAPADKKTSRVPRYQNGEKLSGTAIFRVKSPHIGGDLERVDVSFASFLCAKEKEGKKFLFFAPKKKRNKKIFLNKNIALL
jgi:hypothetical protein